MTAMSCYLLHYERTDRRKLHYFGATLSNRLHERLAEHQRGDGASITRWMTSAGYGFYLARVFDGAGYDYEKRVKSAGRIRQLCPICRSGKLPLPLEGVFFPPRAPFAGSVMIDWPEPSSQASPRKGP